MTQSEFTFKLAQYYFGNKKGFVPMPGPGMAGDPAMAGPPPGGMPPGAGGPPPGMMPPGAGGPPPGAMPPGAMPPGAMPPPGMDPSMGAGPPPGVPPQGDPNAGAAPPPPAGPPPSNALTEERVRQLISEGAGGAKEKKEDPMETRLGNIETVLKHLAGTLGVNVPAHTVLGPAHTEATSSGGGSGGGSSGDSGKTAGYEIGRPVQEPSKSAARPRPIKSAAITLLSGRVAAEAAAARRKSQ